MREITTSLRYQLSSLFHHLMRALRGPRAHPELRHAQTLIPARQRPSRHRAFLCYLLFATCYLLLSPAPPARPNPPPAHAHRAQRNAAHAADPNRTQAPDSILVRFAPQANDQARAALRTQVNGQTLHTYDSVPG